MEEFELIRKFFESSTLQRDDVVLGIGDDCALLSPPPAKQLAISTDTLVSGVHFPETTSAYNIGYKSLAVNLSDLAAMGAEPAWVSLAMTLPKSNSAWIEQFMQGFNALACLYPLSLIGGDTTSGALSVTVSIIGFVDANTALKRSNARPGDAIFVTGNIGDARLGLESYLNQLQMGQSQMDYFRNSLDRPEPQIQAGLILSRYKHVAAIDLSDGLLADLQHICDASGVGATLRLQNLPLSNELRDFYTDAINWPLLLNAGDDYQLCFTCSLDDSLSIKKEFKHNNIKMTQIGEITSATSIRCYQHDIEINTEHFSGYTHFSDEK